MSMKKWTDEELISTRDKLEEWNSRYKKSGNKLWHFTAFLGAFAVSTGIVFIFFDGVDVLNIILIILGAVTCLSWYKSEKQRKDNQSFLYEINQELKRRDKKAAKSKEKTVDTDKNKEKQQANQTDPGSKETEAEKNSNKEAEQEGKN